jgi:hypothetical protein
VQKFSVYCVKLKAVEVDLRRRFAARHLCAGTASFGQAYGNSLLAVLVLTLFEVMHLGADFLLRLAAVFAATATLAAGGSAASAPAGRSAFAA